MCHQLPAQIYNELVTNTTGINSNFEELSSLVENPNTEQLISASSVRQPGSQLDDIKIQVFDPQGAVISSFRVGNPSRSELVTGIALCDDERTAIVVGELFSFVPGVTNRAFIMRVEIFTGNVVWYQQLAAFAGVTTNDRFNGVVRNQKSSKEAYLVYGNSRGFDGTGAGLFNNRNKVILANFDVNGAILGYSLVYDDFPNTNINGEFFPTDIALNARGNYTLTGSYEEQAGGQSLVDVFIMEVSPAATPINNSLIRLDISDFTGVNIRNVAPKIYCDNPSNQYFIACSSSQLFGNTNNTYLTGVLIDQNSFVVSWANAFYEPAFESNRVSGVGKVPGGQNYLIGGMLNSNPSPNPNFVLSTLEVDPLGAPLDFIEYDPVISTVGYGYYCSIVGFRSIYHKGQLTSSNQERIIRTDPNGLGTAYACFQNHPAIVDPLLTSLKKVRLEISQEPRLRRLRSLLNTVHGTVLYCDSTQLSYRLAQSASMAQADAKLFPSIVSDNSFSTLTYKSTDAQRCQVQIFDLSAKLSFSKEFLSEKGDNTISIQARNLPKGACLVRLVDEQGTLLFSSKLLRL
jgi:hypothetical protein